MEFWRMKDVSQATGLSRTEIHRRIKLGQFPDSRPYPGDGIARFWPSTEIVKWQREILGEDEFEALLR